MRHGQLASEFAPKLNDNNQELSNALNNQGLAYKRNREFNEAEAAYLHGMRVIFQTHGVRAFEATHLVDTLSVNLESVYKAKSVCNEPDAEFKVESLGLLSCMSKVAKLKEPSDLQYAPVKEVLQRKFLTVSAAKNALTEAYLTATVDDFHTKVRTWQHNKFDFKLPANGDDPKTLAELKKLDKERARKSVREQGQLPQRTCNNPGCSLGADSLFAVQVGPVLFEGVSGCQLERA